MSQNAKMVGSHIVECPEIEEAKACIHFDAEGRASPKCPGCYALALFPMRRAGWKSKQETPRRGLIRLGTWREITKEDYGAFLAGRGVRANGDEWVRPDLPRRAHFVITRGLEPKELYRQMLDNPRCLNIQVSVDIIKTAAGTTQWPSDERLQWFQQFGKVLFRFKALGDDVTRSGVTYQRNVEEFTALADRIGIPYGRVLETPLRLSGNRQYHTETPLEAAGWNPTKFWRCNSECSDCGTTPTKQGENQFLVCAATETILRRIQNVVPARVEKQPRLKVAWKDVVMGVIEKHEGPIALPQLYLDVEKVSPDAATSPVFKEKVRQVAAKHATRIHRGVYARK